MSLCIITEIYNLIANKKIIIISLNKCIIFVQTITIKTFTTMLVKFNNEKDFFTWIKDHVSDTATIIDGDNEISNPDNYPCVMVYNFIKNPVLDCEEDEDQYYDLLSQGYEEHEIDKLYYDFVYPYDFDSNHQ